jgi:hypothetical protein
MSYDIGFLEIKHGSLDIRSCFAKNFNMHCMSTETGFFEMAGAVIQS